MSWSYGSGIPSLLLNSSDQEIDFVLTQELCETSFCFLGKVDKKNGADASDQTDDGTVENENPSPTSNAWQDTRFNVRVCLGRSIMLTPPLLYGGRAYTKAAEEEKGVGSPVLMVLSCHPDTHYSCIRVRPVSILLGRDPHTVTLLIIQPSYTCYKKGIHCFTH